MKIFWEDIVKNRCGHYDQEILKLVASEEQNYFLHVVTTCKKLKVTLKLLGGCGQKWV